VPKTCVFLIVVSKRERRLFKYAKCAKQRFIKLLFTGYVQSGLEFAILLRNVSYGFLRTGLMSSVHPATKIGASPHCVKSHVILERS